jgi:uncharacterized protein
MVSQDLLDVIRRGFALRLDGIHGEAHWARVRDNGLRLAGQTGADPEIVEFFAFLHDAKRQNDGWDREHGRRAAVFVRGLQGSLLTLSAEKLECLIYACACHSDGLTEGGVTVQTCWDADRLDLGRIGIRPSPRYLCTEAAKDPVMIEWAFHRSRGADSMLHPPSTQPSPL